MIVRMGALVDRKPTPKTPGLVPISLTRWQIARGDVRITNSDQAVTAMVGEGQELPEWCCLAAMWEQRRLKWNHFEHQELLV